ncbi:MAG: hypothetical protein IPF95_18055 [Flavobacteriales bacterium]|nr:hypothetical protein [Flavobacteriales bacterium]
MNVKADEVESPVAQNTYTKKTDRRSTKLMVNKGSPSMRMNGPTNKGQARNRRTLIPLGELSIGFFG